MLRPDGPDRTPILDETDLRMLGLLSADGRMSNKELADRLGVAPSTALLRLRRLRDAGVIRGFRAEISPAALGLGLQAIIAVRVRTEHRPRIGALARRFAALPGVLNVYFLSGGDDYQLHVAARSSDDLRDFVVRHLSPMPEVAGTRTSLIFDHMATGPFPA
jgi:DNA-binding Lrp family transcriptional regulator